jgi:N-methylhydantoinase B
MGRDEISPGESIVMELPGGGGIGNPRDRRTDDIRRDLKNELMSAGAAREMYGFDAGEGIIDEDD